MQQNNNQNINQDLQDQKTCKICLDHEESKENPLISPCRCNGSMRFIHRECLLRTRERNYYQCSVCHFRYQYRRLWWGSLLESKTVQSIITISGICFMIYGSGQISARIVNRIWYFLHHEDYCLPNRLQVLFYGLVCVGIPGLWIGLTELLSQLDDLIREVPDRPLRINFQPNFFSGPSNPRPVQQEFKEQKEDQKESKDHEENKEESKDNNKKSNKKTKKKPLKVAKYESPSPVWWIIFSAGVVQCGWSVFNWIQAKCQWYCAQAQEMIENIH